MKPTKTLQDANNLLLRLRVIPAEENVMIPICYLLGIDHNIGIDRVQGLDDFHLRESALDLFP